MIRIGCTGHQGLSASTRRNVAAAVAGVVAGQSDDTLVGYTSLAEGADQAFAFAVLAAGGQLHAVIPSQGYAETFATDEARDSYAALVKLATDTTLLPFSEPSEDAYLAAGHAIVERCDLLIAVWDGQRAVGKGGTGDVVAYAKKLGVDIRVIWPTGSRRI